MRDGMDGDWPVAYLQQWCRVSTSTHPMHMLTDLLTLPPLDAHWPTLAAASVLLASATTLWALIRQWQRRETGP